MLEAEVSLGPRMVCVDPEKRCLCPESLTIAMWRVNTEAIVQESGI